MLGKISNLFLKKTLSQFRSHFFFRVEVLNVVLFFHFLSSLLQNAKGAVCKERISN